MEGVVVVERVVNGVVVVEDVVKGVGVVMGGVVGKVTKVVPHSSVSGTIKTVHQFSQRGSLEQIFIEHKFYSPQPSVSYITNPVHTKLPLTLLLEWSHSGLNEV